MEKHRCAFCNYTYDEKRGDPVNGVHSGTPFAELPATWVCPVCGARKSDFVKVPA